MSICFMSNVYASVRTFVIKLKINCAVLTRMEEDSEDAKLSSKFLNNLKGKRMIDVLKRDVKLRFGK